MHILNWLYGKIWGRYGSGLDWPMGTFKGIWSVPGGSEDSVLRGMSHSTYPWQPMMALLSCPSHNRVGWGKNTGSL